MFKLMLFAGTTEGRELARAFCGEEIEITVCVATDYGKTLIDEGENLTILSGRLDQQQIAEQMSETTYDLVVDATHPYAVEVSENIKAACENIGTEYMRIIRRSELAAEQEKTAGNAIYAASVTEAVQLLKQKNGNVLVTTGSKELEKYTELPDYKERLTVRVLSSGEAVRKALSLGFEGKRLICMQGPFSQEMNTAMLKSIQARYMVTKESGKNGGFEEKIRAAKEAGADVIVIGRPVKEEGCTLDEGISYIAKKAGISVRPNIALIGAGMGNAEMLTTAAEKRITGADVIIGAARLTETFKLPNQQVFVSYRADEIRNYIDSHPSQKNVAILLSGDPGFYSAAKSIIAELAGFWPEVLPGISSLSYFAGKLKIAWQDIKTLSLHGREAVVIPYLRTNPRLFLLVGKGRQIEELCKEFIAYGMNDITISIGENLGSDEERIITGRPEQLLAGTGFSDLAVVYLEQKEVIPETVVHGIPDQEFIRANVPMTKQEIRSISLSKLRLTRDAVVYDIGAGTGSVAVECALRACQGKVYAIEYKETAIKLLWKNKYKFRAANMEIVEGKAPEAMLLLPHPTHVFIGGSSGRIGEILDILCAEAQVPEIVINAITLETMSEVLKWKKQNTHICMEFVQVAASRADEVGPYHMLKSENPIFIITIRGGAADG